MSDLHFDADGEHATVPADAEELRVRRFRKPGERGACEVVHGPDGAPLFVPVEIGYLDFRKVVDGVPGRYRLDPVDADRKPCPDAVALYVTIEATRNAASAADERDSLTRELLRANVEMMRANVEMTKNVTERLASMMTATAEILRAADGAGIASRTPAPAATPPADGDGDECDGCEDCDGDGEDDQTELGDPGHVLAPLVAVLAGIIKQSAPAIQALALTKARGIGKPAGGAPPATTAPAVDLASTSAPPPATPPTTASTPGVAVPSAPAEAPIAPPLSAAPSPVAADATASAPEVRNAAPSAEVEIEPAQLAHLVAINAELTPREQRVVMKVIQNFAPAAKVEWVGKLCALSVADAVALVRRLIPPPGRKPPGCNVGAAQVVAPTNKEPQP